MAVVSVVADLPRGGIYGRIVSYTVLSVKINNQFTGSHYRMGYVSRFDGEIQICPPLKWSQFRDLDLSAIRLVVDKIKTDTDEGYLIVKEAVAITPITDDSYKGYSFSEEIQQVVDAAGPNHSFEGHIMREGEDSGDITRYIVKDGKVQEQRATFTFED